MVKKLLQYWTDSDWPCDFISDQRVKTAWKPNISNSVTQYLRLLPNRRYGGALCVVYIWKMTLTYHNVIKNPRKCNSWRVEIDLIFITVLCCIWRNVFQIQESVNQFHDIFLFVLEHCAYFSGLSSKNILLYKTFMHEWKLFIFGETLFWLSNK